MQVCVVDTTEYDAGEEFHITSDGKTLSENACAIPDVNPKLSKDQC